MCKLLVVVPCGKAKVWDRDPDRGPVSAECAYTGSPYKANRQYAKRFGDKWVILSAKYGFICPSFVIPESYDVRFGRRSADEVSLATLRQQASDLLGRWRFHNMIALGGREYRDAVERAVESLPVCLYFPFRSMGLFKAMAATKRAVATGDPGVCICCKPGCIVPDHQH
jgi:hypothetical protein